MRRESPPLLLLGRTKVAGRGGCGCCCCCCCWGRDGIAKEFCRGEREGGATTM